MALFPEPDGMRRVWSTWVSGICFGEVAFYVMCC